MEDGEREGRDIILYYLVESLKEFFAINPALVSTGFVKMLKRKLPEYSKQFAGEVIDPKEFKGMEDFDKAVGLMEKAMVRRKLHGGSAIERPTPTTLIATIKDCSYKDFAKLCVKEGHKGCIFCPIVFAGQAVPAATGVALTSKVDYEFDMATGTCTITSDFTPSE